MAVALKNLDKWNEFYRTLKIDTPIPYGDHITYEIGASFLSDIDTVEDWGCGMGYFKSHYKGKYIGIDGSNTPFASTKADLTEYKSDVDGIFMRHILEHNYEWKKVLSNAISSFKKKMVLILFTAFSDETKQVLYSDHFKVPDISFKKSDITEFLKGCEWECLENLKTNTQYGVEHIFLLEKKQATPAKTVVKS